MSMNGKILPIHCFKVLKYMKLEYVIEKRILAFMNMPKKNMTSTILKIRLFIAQIYPRIRKLISMVTKQQLSR